MAGDPLNSWIVILRGVADGSSDVDHTDAQSQLASLIAEEPYNLLCVCAHVIVHEPHPVRLICTAFQVITLLLKPTVFQGIDLKRQRWSGIFSREERETFTIIVATALTYSDPTIRVFASECILQLSRVDLAEALNLFSFLLELMSSTQYPPCVGLNALCTLRQMYQSGIISELHPAKILPILEGQIDFFYKAIESPGQYSGTFMNQVVLSLSALIPNLTEQFRPVAQQQRLVNYMQNLILTEDADRLYDSILVLFQIQVQTYYDGWESPLAQIAQFTYTGLLSGSSQFLGVSLRWWTGFCEWENFRFLLNQRVLAYEAGLLWLCSQEALATCPNLHLWRLEQLHFISENFVNNALGIVIAILFDVHRPPDESDSALVLLRCLGRNMPSLVFPAVLEALGVQSSAGCVSPRTALLSLDLFCSAPDHCDTVIDCLRSNVSGIFPLLTDASSELRELAFDVLLKMIHRLSQSFSVTDLDNMFDSINAVELAVPIESAYFLCVTALFQCPAASDLDMTRNAELILFMTDRIESELGQFAGPEVVNDAFGMVAAIISVLPNEASDFVISYYRSIMEKLVTIASADFEATILSVVQQSYLAILGVLFRVQQTSLIEAASETIAFLLAGITAERIPIVEDLIRTITIIASGMRKAHGMIHTDLVGPLLDLAISILQEEDLNMVAETYFLLAHLIHSTPGIPLCALEGIVARMRFLLRNETCLPKFIPKLLSGFAAVIREFPSDVPPELLDDCLCEYQQAWFIPLGMENSDEVEYGNQICQSIFTGLSALLHAGRGSKDFLNAHQSHWFGGISRMVRAFGIVLNFTTLVSYTVFLQHALDYLPIFCWPEMIKIFNRVPLICGIVSECPTVRDMNMLVWNVLLAK
jgi:hypothetical protein